MNMIGHQHISMNPTARLVGAVGQPVETGAVILVREKARLPIVATLDQVEHSPRQDEDDGHEAISF
jgi:hypothetical protein